jgi:hypothetical protein
MRNPLRRSLRSKATPGARVTPDIRAYRNALSFYAARVASVIVNCSDNEQVLVRKAPGGKCLAAHRQSTN